MRSSHARLMVLGTAALALGALACTHDLGTGPQAASGPSYARGGASGKMRSFHGRNATFDVDHDAAVVRNRATGQEAKLDRAQLAQVEKSFDGLEAIDARLNKLRRDPAFAQAMERAAANPRKVRLRIVQPPTPAPARSPVLAGGVSSSMGASTAGTFAGELGPCTDLELMIYYGTLEYQEAQRAYEDLLQNMVTLGWGFNGDGSYGFDPARYLAQIASFALKLDLLAYRIVALRNTLDYLAIQYQLMGCWNQGSDGGGSSTPKDCHSEYVRMEVDINGVWETTWEGYIEVCDAAT